MAAKRLSMRKIKEVLRLKWEHGLSNRKIARSCSISRSTVAEYLRRAEEAGLSWPLPPELDEAELEKQLFPPPLVLPPGSRPLPDWSYIHRELRRKGVTLFLLWHTEPGPASSMSSCARSTEQEKSSSWTMPAKPCLW